MKLQEEIKKYLSKYGIAKSHMAKVIGVYQSQLSAWFNGKLVLSDCHMVKIDEYGQTLKALSEFLDKNNLVL